MLFGISFQSFTAVLILVMATVRSSSAAVEPLLRSQNLFDDSIVLRVPGGTEMLVHDGKCRIAFQKDGNLSVNKRRGEPPYNPLGAFPTMWDTGAIGAGNYEVSFFLFSVSFHVNNVFYCFCEISYTKY